MGVKIGFDVEYSFNTSCGNKIAVVYHVVTDGERLMLTFCCGHCSRRGIDSVKGISERLESVKEFILTAVQPPKAERSL